VLLLDKSQARRIGGGCMHGVITSLNIDPPNFKKKLVITSSNITPLSLKFFM